MRFDGFDPILTVLRLSRLRELSANLKSVPADWGSSTLLSLYAKTQFWLPMNTIEGQVTQPCRHDGKPNDCIGRLIRYLAAQVKPSPSNCGCVGEHRCHFYEVFMQIKVLELLQLNLHTHSSLQCVNLQCYGELPGMQVMRGVFSPEFATDSYHWARFITQKGLVRRKNVLEMGAGSGVISLYLQRKENPLRICAVDVNSNAVVNLSANLDLFDIDRSGFDVIESDLFDRVPVEIRFDVILWAMPWILVEDPYFRQVLGECEDPLEQALLRSAIDPGAESVLRFISDAKSRLSPGGKVLLISSDFIPNWLIRAHAESEGFAVEETKFARELMVVEATGMTLDLIHIELTLQ